MSKTSGNIKVKRYYNNMTINIKWSHRFDANQSVSQILSIISVFFMSFGLILVILKGGLENSFLNFLFFLLTLLLILIDIPLICFLLIKCFNKTTLLVNKKYLLKFHKPIPIPFVKIKQFQLRKIYSSEKIISTLYKKYTDYSVNFKTFGEGDKTIINPNTQDEMLFIKEKLKDYLNISELRP